MKPLWLDSAHIYMSADKAVEKEVSPKALWGVVIIKAVNPQMGTCINLSRYLSRGRMP